MCVIVIKKKGVKMPSKEDLKLCWNRNPDGAGFSVRTKDIVHFEKGFDDFEAFYERVKNFKANDEVVMHFRIATQGGINKPMCHPFVLSNKSSETKKISGDEKTVVFHNGILKITSTQALKERFPDESDTSLFVRKICYPLLSSTGMTQLNMDALESIAGVSNKLVFHTSRGIIALGYFIKGDNGCYYSNSYSLPNMNYSYKWYN